MVYLKVKVEKTDFDQPGFLYCTFLDVHNKEWKIVEKAPVLFSNATFLEKLANEGFYFPGHILSTSGNIIVFSTLEPYGICSEDGETTFVVNVNQIADVQN